MEKARTFDFAEVFVMKPRGLRILQADRMGLHLHHAATDRIYIVTYLAGEFHLSYTSPKYNEPQYIGRTDDLNRVLQWVGCKAKGK